MQPRAKLELVRKEKPKKAADLGRIMTTEQAAEFLALAPSTLATWRCKGGKRGPDFLKYDRAVRYSERELERWLESRMMRNTSEPHPDE